MNRRVLVVEDDHDSRHALHKLLAKAGHTVVSVDSVAAAVAALMLVPEVVLLDLMLPEASGLSLLPNLRQLTPIPRVAFVSANIPPMIADYHPHPVFFRKPVDFHALDRWIRDPNSDVPTPSHSLV